MRSSFDRYSARVILVFILLICGSPVRADQLPFPEPANENAYAVPMENLRLRLWAQYRVLYNASNIPSGVNNGSLPFAGTGPGKLNYGDTTGYDFFRQRMRLAFDIRPKDDDHVGGYMQMEFRGGFGGSSPAASDPRGESGANADGTPNAFNRLQARGVRYGYVYFTPIENHTLVVGILPTLDQVGRVLWDGEWDFFVGGASLGGKLGEADYRLGFYRFASDLKAGTIGQGFGKDGDMWVTDYNTPLKLGSYDLKVGGHYYTMNLGKTENISIGDTHEHWVALTASGSLFTTGAWNSYLMVNSGRIGTGTTGNNHTGYSGKFEGALPIGPATLNLFALYSSGDKAGQTSNQFTTPEAILGTNGYWGYSHIFNANAPGDVNDFGINLNNGGAGLWTVQGQLKFPIIPRLTGTLETAYFAAARSRDFGTRGATTYMGTETGGMVTYNLAKNLNLDVGFAHAFMGDFLANRTQATNVERSIYEFFTRFQYAL
ncbi:MAG: hypothetical protein ABL965_04060 [Nitrospira sp.]|nr:MAG: hypothetical protein E8D44_00610 [Nitrospira sp.]